MITGVQIADAALKSDLIGTPYSKLDCQALVEEVLKRAGLKIINYRGSNHMWRDLVYDRVSTNDAVILPGMLAFIVKNDGGEKKRGYHDNMGNATHVAIALGDGTVYESTTGGVQISSMRKFTHVAKIIDVDYENAVPEIPGKETTADRISAIREVLLQVCAELEAMKNDLHRDS